jgi:hypothetical protein
MAEEYIGLEDWNWEVGEVEKGRRGKDTFDCGAWADNKVVRRVVDPKVRQMEWRLEAGRSARVAIAFIR